MNFDAVLIAGPTASGKSHAALALAERIGGVIVNADSMQIYAEAPILSAQPRDEDKARAPHMLYGHVSAKEFYSVGRWRDDALEALAKTRALKKIAIFTGGTGMYFSALTQGIAEIPAIEPEIRSKTRALLEQWGVEKLHAKLLLKDPLTASKLRPTDCQRILRAWEVFESTGRPLAKWQQMKATPILNNLNYAAFVLDPPRPYLRARIAQRFERMLEEGALKEAEQLMGLDPALPAAKLLGLRPLQGLAKGRLSRKDALEESIAATRQLGKRQITWFRHRMTDSIWFNPLSSNIITQFSRISA